MAKLSFSKLGINKINTDIVKIHYNDQEIEVKQYLPISEKMELISHVLNQSAEDKKFYNTGKIETFFTLGLVYNYTNLSFTAKQKEDQIKLYDLIVSSGLFTQIYNAIPASEISFIKETIEKMVKAIYNYDNSVLGILDAITTDYDNLNFDITELQKKIADGENIELLKTIMAKLG